MTSSEPVIPRRDAEELAEALDTITVSADRAIRQASSRQAADELFFDTSAAHDALSRFRSKYPKEDTDG